MRAVPVLMLVVALAACAPVVPESGVGFGDYSQYLKDRERALAQGSAPPAAIAPVVAPPAPAGFSTDRASAAIDAAEGRTATAALAAAPPLAALPDRKSVV